MSIVLPLLAALALPAADDEPPLAERRELYDAYLLAPALVRGGVVLPRWLADGSSFWYRRGHRRMFVDPALGAPRQATDEDRARELEEDRGGLVGGRLHAPNGDHLVGLEDGQLVVSGGAFATPLALTDDGGEDVLWMLEGHGWSPQGDRLVARRMDLHPVHHVPVVDYLQAVETLERVPYVKAGTPFAGLELAVFHLPTDAAGPVERVAVDLGTDEDVYVFPCGWREANGELLFLRLTRDAQRLDLMAADPRSGASRVVLTDESETFVGGLDFLTSGWEQYVTPIEGADELLWLSERDGWRQLYRYDFEGRLINRVTSGAFPVGRVVGVDRERGRVFFTGSAEPRLYDTHLYRVPLEGGEHVRLTEAPGEHAVHLSPSKDYFVDVHSSLDRPPRSELRDVDGELVCALDEAEVSGLDELGWTPPEPFVVKADDGETDLYGVLFKPRWFDPTQRYPVIDFIYTGPFITVVPNDFRLSTHLAPRAQAMAQLGFVTLIVDPRGTAERSKAFQDASFGRIGEIEIPDHVATLHQLAAERPWMDLEHVGVYGHSWGGYFALRAMLTAPDVFHAGVAGAPGELTEAAPINEPYMGTPESNPQGYAAGLNAPLAANLAGELLLIHGTADVNAPFSTTMRMVQALIEADKDFDLLVMPGGLHGFRGAQLRYETRRIQDFFLEHLRGEQAAR